MPFTSFSAGAKLRASSLNAALAYVPTLKVKTTDETISNNTTYQNDDVLFLTVEANATYNYRMSLIYQATAVADFKWQLTGPAGIAFLTGGSFIGYNAASAFTYATQPGSVTGLGGTAANVPVDIVGSFTTAGTAGTLQLQWAQNTAEVSNCIVRAGSSLWLQKV